jgi:hypothetical protein
MVSPAFAALQRVWRFGCDRSNPVPVSDVVADLPSRGVVGMGSFARRRRLRGPVTVADDRVEAFAQAAQRAGSSHRHGVAGSAAPKFLDGQGSEIVLKRRSTAIFEDSWSWRTLFAAAIAIPAKTYTYANSIAVVPF